MLCIQMGLSIPQVRMLSRAYYFACISLCWDVKVMRPAKWLCRCSTLKRDVNGGNTSTHSVMNRPAELSYNAHSLQRFLVQGVDNKLSQFYRLPLQYTTCILQALTARLDISYVRVMRNNLNSYVFKWGEGIHILKATKTWFDIKCKIHKHIYTKKWSVVCINMEIGQKTWSSGIPTPTCIKSNLYTNYQNLFFSRMYTTRKIHCSFTGWIFKFLIKKLKWHKKQEYAKKKVSFIAVQVCPQN